MILQNTLDNAAASLLGLVALGCAVALAADEAHVQWQKSYVDMSTLKNVSDDACVKKWVNVDLKDGAPITNKRLEDLQFFCRWQEKAAIETAARSSLISKQIAAVN